MINEGKSTERRKSIHNYEHQPLTTHLKYSGSDLNALAKALQKESKLKSMRKFLRRTTSEQQRRSGHCSVILRAPSIGRNNISISGNPYMFSIAAAEEVLPRRRNHGLKPMDVPA